MNTPILLRLGNIDGRWTSFRYQIESDIWRFLPASGKRKPSETRTREVHMRMHHFYIELPIPAVTCRTDW